MKILCPFWLRVCALTKRMEPHNPVHEKTATQSPSSEAAPLHTPSAAAVFAAALEAAPEDRDSVIEARCAGNPALRQRVLQLLAAREEAGNFLETLLPATEALIAEFGQRKTGGVPIEILEPAGPSPMTKLGTP